MPYKDIDKQREAKERWKAKQAESLLYFTKGVPKKGIPSRRYNPITELCRMMAGQK